MTRHGEGTHGNVGATDQLTTFRIVIDAMGGDHAPLEAVKGACVFAQQTPDVTLLLTGREPELTGLIQDCCGSIPLNMEICHAGDVVGMDESPVSAVKEKKDSSIAVAVNLVKEGRADAVVSAGNTGVMVTQSTLGLKRIQNVKRPGIITPLPGEQGVFFLIDAGANSEGKPEVMYQHAVLGAIYCQNYLRKARPTVGLLNIGTEESKGNLLVKDVNRLIREANHEFFEYVGYVEGNTITKGDCDLVVCDGFVGNVVLKLVEGVAESLMRGIQEDIASGFIKKVGAKILNSTFAGIRDRYGYETYGGAMLLGVDGLCTILHGVSSAVAFQNGLKVTAELCRQDMHTKMKEQMFLLKEESGQ